MKKILILLALFLMIMSIPTISATDNATNEIIAADNNIAEDIVTIDDTMGDVIAIEDYNESINSMCSQNQSLNLEEKISFSDLDSTKSSLYENKDLLTEDETTYDGYIDAKDLEVGYQDEIEYTFSVVGKYDRTDYIDYYIIDSDSIVKGVGRIELLSENLTISAHLKAGNYTVSLYFRDRGPYKNNMKYVKTNLIIKPNYLFNDYDEMFIQPLTMYSDQVKDITYGWKGFFKGTLEIYKGKTFIERMELDNSCYVSDYVNYTNFKETVSINLIPVGHIQQK